MSVFQLTVDNKVLNISINIADLLAHGSINISLNQNAVSQSLQQPAIQVAEVITDTTNVIDDTTNVTFRSPKKTKKSKPKQKKQLIIEEDEDEVPLSKEVLSEEKRKKYISHKYEKDESGLLKCPYCDCKKKNLSTISMHVAANHASEMGKEVNPHKCEYPDCGKSFPIKTRLQHHINNHHKKDNLCCPFPNCGYTDSKNKATLYTHYVRKHMNTDRMCSGTVCNTCNSDKNTGIIYHLATCHPDSPFCKLVGQ
jgi:uncharacterized Zn-finger protein